MLKGQVREHDLVLQLGGISVSLVGSDDARDRLGQPRFQVGITPCLPSCGDPRCTSDHPLIVGGQMLTLAMPVDVARELIGMLTETIKVVEDAEHSGVSGAQLRTSLEGPSS